MEGQVKRGVDVRYIFIENIGAQIEIIDYAIWDNSVCVKLLEPRYAGEDFKAEFYFGGKITEKLNQHFKTLYNAAKAFEIQEA